MKMIKGIGAFLDFLSENIKPLNDSIRIDVFGNIVYLEFKDTLLKFWKTWEIIAIFEDITSGEKLSVDLFNKDYLDLVTNILENYEKEFDRETELIY